MSMNNMFFQLSNTRMCIYLLLVLCFNLSAVIGRIPSRPVAKQASTYGKSCKTPDGKLGECIHHKSCSYLSEKNLTIGMPDKSQCSPPSQSTERFVCCAIDHDCGKHMNSVGKISRGKNSSLGDWPWMVALGHINLDNKSKPVFTIFCGGTLISRRWILTAAHCIRNKDGFTARLGDLDLDPNIADGASPIDEPIEKSIIHPKHYEWRRSLENDIGLLRLKNTVNYTRNIGHICLPAGEKFQLESYYAGKRPTVIGWGFDEPGNKTSHLQEATLEYYNNSACAKMYNDRGFVINDRTLCAADNGKDSCSGDSGGPLNFLDTDKTDGGYDRYFLGGIVSTGASCGNPKLPGIYTRVAAFMDWINETMLNS